MKTSLFYFAAGILMLIGMLASGMLLLGSVMVGTRGSGEKSASCLIDDDPVCLPN